MGFKVTVRKNGATHGESHYTSEAVAAGMVAKMRNAGADVSVARCNGTGCGCDGMKSNPRHNPSGMAEAKGIAYKAMIASGAVTPTEAVHALVAHEIAKSKAKAQAKAKAKAKATPSGPYVILWERKSPSFASQFGGARAPVAPAKWLQRKAKYPNLYSASYDKPQFVYQIAPAAGGKFALKMEHQAGSSADPTVLLGLYPTVADAKAAAEIDAVARGAIVQQPKSNPKSKPKEPPVWEREGHSQRNPRRNGKKFKMPSAKSANAEAVAAARAVGRTAYARGVKSAPAQDPMLRPLIAAHPGDTSTILGMMDAWQKEWNKAHQIASNAEVAALGIFPKSNRRRNGTTAANIAASRSLVHRSGLVRNGSKQIVATHDITIEGQRFPKGTAFSRKRKYGQNGWDYYLPGWSEEEGGYGWTADSEGVLTKAKANPRRNGKAKTVGMDDTVQFGQIAFYSTTPKRVIVKRKMHDGFREQPGYAYRGYYLVQGYTPKSFDEGGPLVPRAGAPWTVLHESGLSVVFNAPTLKGAQAVVDGLRETEGGRAIATTPAKDVMQYEDDVKRLYGRSFTRNRRNGAAKTETFAVARKRIFNEFGAAGWKLSSPTLLVLHATSPDGRTRAWFKPQAVYYTTVGKGQRHDAGDGHTVSYSLDIRTVPPGVFVPWFIKNFDK